MTISGTCHCGATRFEVATVPTEAVECNCTYCSKAGGLWAYYEPEDFSAAGPDRVYSKTGYNKHHTSVRPAAARPMGSPPNGRSTAPMNSTSSGSA